MKSLSAGWRYDGTSGAGVEGIHYRAGNEKKHDLRGGCARRSCFVVLIYNLNISLRRRYIVIPPSSEIFIAKPNVEAWKVAIERAPPDTLSRVS